MDDDPKDGSGNGTGNAFTESFLVRALARNEPAGLVDEASFSGDWQVREHEGRHLLLRDWERAGIDDPPCWFHLPERAHLGVAALAASARAPLFAYGPETPRGTYPILLLDSGEQPVIVGENRLFDQTYLAYLHGVEMLARNPRAFAYLGQALGGEALRMAGRILVGRMDE